MNVGISIEDAIQEGKFLKEDGAGSSGISGGNGRGKKPASQGKAPEVSATFPPMRPQHYPPTPPTYQSYAPPPPSYAPPPPPRQYQPRPTPSTNPSAGTSAYRARHFDDLGRPLSVVLNKLIQRGILQPLDPRPLPNPLSPNFNHNQYCAFHQSQGHLTDRCMRLRHVIQDLIENGTIPAPIKPNITNNPFPAHDRQANQISEEPLMDPSQYIVPLSCPRPRAATLFEDHVCMMNGDENNFWDFPDENMDLNYQQGGGFWMDPNDLGPQLDMGFWNDVGSQEDQGFWMDLNENKVEHLTRGGRHFKPSELDPTRTEPQQDQGNKRKEKGKVCIEEGSHMEEENARQEKGKRKIGEEEEAEEIRVREEERRERKKEERRKEIEKEDYEVLKQLKKTQANISIWQLLMMSLPHRQALLEAMGQADVPTDLSPEQLVGMVSHFKTDTVITFNDQDLPAEGVDHAKALLITVECLESWVPSVLIDNGSALNICPF